MRKVLLADDENLIVKGLSKLIDWAALDIEIVGEAIDGLSAEQMILERHPDLVISDIRMPGLTGLELLTRHKGGSQAPKFILISGYEEFEYVKQALSNGAVDYLLKPFSFEEFSRAVAKAKSLYELMKLRDKQSQVDSSVVDNASGGEDNESISIKADYKVTMVRFADIIFIESVGEYVRLHLTNAPAITTLFRLKNMETALPSDKFMRVHRSYIVNLGHVSGYSRSRVMLDNGEYVPVSVNYRDSFRKYIERSMLSMQI